MCLRFSIQEAHLPAHRLTRHNAGEIFGIKFEWEKKPFESHHANPPVVADLKILADTEFSHRCSPFFRLPLLPSLNATT